jgi:hypothetical protein
MANTPEATPYAGWPFKGETCSLIPDCSPRTLDRMIKREQIRTARKLVAGKGWMVVCNPDDVERMANSRRAEILSGLPGSRQVAQRVGPVATAEVLYLSDLYFFTIRQAALRSGLTQSLISRIVRKTNLLAWGKDLIYDRQYKLTRAGVDRLAEVSLLLPAQPKLLAPPAPPVNFRRAQFGKPAQLQGVSA